MRALITAVAAVALLVPSVAFAEVVDRGPNGFTLKTGVEITMTYAVGGYAPGASRRWRSWSMPSWRTRSAS